jgi:hypothetical protein
MKKTILPRGAVGLLLTLFASVSALAADRINITQPPYNAVPNDGVSDKTAIDAAIGAGRSIYFPPGTYDYPGLMSLPANQSYRLYGDGPGVSKIVFTGSSAGIYGSSMGTKNLNVEGLTLQANTANCGTAIQAYFYDAGANRKFHNATIRNVQIRGSTADGYSGGYWTGGIRLYQAQNSVLEGVEILGNARQGDCPGTPATQTGIVWDSYSYTSSGLQMSNIQVKFCNSALRTNGYVENLFLTGFEFPFCGNFNSPAVDLNSSDPNLGGFHLVNGHVAALQAGLRLTNLRGVKISKVSINHFSGNACASSGTDLALSNVRDAVISQCSFIGVDESVPDSTGIRVENSHVVQILGNNFFQLRPGNAFSNPQDAAINVQATSDSVRVVNNLFDSVSVPYYNAAGANTYFRGNNR